MKKINILKEKIEVLELKLLDTSNKFNLNKQYSNTLEEKIEELSTANNNTELYILFVIILILIIIIIVMYKKNLVLSKLNKSNNKCAKFI